MVGDPSGKTELRQMLTQETIAANVAKIQTQLSRFLEFGEGKAAMVNNADWLLKLDARNPQIAARLAGAFETWRRYDEGRRGLMRAQLDRIAGTEGLSKDLRDIVTRLTAD